MVYPYIPSRRVFMKISYSIFFLIVSFSLSAQVIWSGAGGDGQWINPANWKESKVPGQTDEVLLDNSMVIDNYTVALPVGNSAIIVQRITIKPGNGKIIQLVLPAGNMASPALSATGDGDGIIINDGGVLDNSSSLKSDAAITLTGKLRINNGGQYIHRSHSSHIELIKALSKVAGTETGIFKFDVPGEAYMISLANYTFGNLILDASASGGTQVYNSIAAYPIIVNNLQINNGVTLNINSNDQFIINRDFIQYGGNFNISDGPASNTISIKGNIMQYAGIITETGSGLPIIELNGSVSQEITLLGNVKQKINLKLNNPAGALLLSNVIMPHKLELINGIMTTIQSHMLILDTFCSIKADSLSNNSFINGPMGKLGLNNSNNFLFPVGKGNTQRWLSLNNATGSYIIEFIKANPYSLSTELKPRLDHISSIEYWSLQSLAAHIASTTNIELSFDNVNSGGVSDLNSLHVAAINPGTYWVDADNIHTTGSAGARGSVTSTFLGFSSGGTNEYLTLGSTTSSQNILPISTIILHARVLDGKNLVSWNAKPDIQAERFILEQSPDGVHFNELTFIWAIGGQGLYSFTDYRMATIKTYYRLHVITTGGSVLYSPVILVENKPIKEPILQVIPSITFNSTRLVFLSNLTGNALIQLYDGQAKQIFARKIKIKEGTNIFLLSLEKYASGNYTVSILINGKIISGRISKE